MLLYAQTVAPSVGGTVDSAEFQQAAYNLSIVHPTGYPLYLLTERLWISIYPFGEPAYRVNLLSSVFAAFAVWVLYASVGRLTSKGPAAWAAILFAVQAIPWSQAGVAEVNSLTTLLVGIAFLALLKWTYGEWPLWAAMLACGLALSHHRTALIFVPLGLAFALLARRRREYKPVSVKGIAGAVFLFAIPFTLYAYLPLRAHTTPTYANTWESFTAYVTGESALPTILNTLSRPLGPRFKLVLFEQAFRGAPGWALLLLGTLGVATVLLLATKRRKVTLYRERWQHLLPSIKNMPAFLLYVAAFVISTVFAALYDIIDIADYMAVPLFLWCVSVGVGIATLFSALPGLVQAIRPHGIGAWRRATQTGIALGLLGLLFLTAGESLARKDVRVDYSNLDRRAEWNSYIEELSGVPSGSIILADGMRFNEALYFRNVEGWRTDLVPIMVEVFQHGNTALVDTWLEEEKRSVYMLGPYPVIMSSYDARQLGSLWQVSGRKSAASTPAMAHRLNYRFGNNIILMGYTMDPDPTALSQGGLLRVTFYWQATERIFERYTVFGHIVDNAGSKVGQRDDEPGQGFKSTITWQPGQIVTDTLEIPVSPDALPGEYSLFTGLYSSVEGRRLEVFASDGQSLGDYVELSKVTVLR